MKTSAAVLSIVSLLIIAPVAVRAGDAPRPSHAFLAEKLAELGVTDDQRQQIHTINVTALCLNIKLMILFISDT